MLNSFRNKSFWRRVEETHYGWMTKGHDARLGDNAPGDVAFIGYEGRQGILFDPESLVAGRGYRVTEARLRVDPEYPRLILRNESWKKAALEVFGRAGSRLSAQQPVDTPEKLMERFPTRSELENSAAPIDTMMIGVASLLLLRSRDQWAAPMLLRDKGAPSYAGCWTPPGGNSSEAPSLTVGKELREELALLIVDPVSKRYVLPVMRMPDEELGEAAAPRPSDIERLRSRASHWYGETYNSEWDIVARDVRLEHLSWARPFESKISIVTAGSNHEVCRLAAMGFYNAPNILGLTKIVGLPPKIGDFPSSDLRIGENCLAVDLEPIPSLPQGRQVDFWSADRLLKAADGPYADEAKRKGQANGALLDLVEMAVRVIGPPLKQYFRDAAP